MRPRAARLKLLELERRDTPSRPLPYPVIYVGAETGAPPTVKAFDAETSAVIIERAVYEPAFAGGVRVATADFTGDGWPDLAVGPGAGGGPRVRVLDGKTGDPVPGPLGDFWAYEPTFTGGVGVAAADVTGDAWPDLIVAAGRGGGPRVRVFDGKTGSQVSDGFVFDPAFGGGVSVAAADLTGDGKAELVVGAGPGGGPHVRVIDIPTGKSIAGPLGSFFAYEPTFTGGVHVGADWKAGDVDADGRADLLVGPGAGRAPVVKVYSGATGAQVRQLTAFAPSMTAGVRVAAAYVTDDPWADVVVSTGPGVPDRVRVFDGRTSKRIAGPTGDFAPFGGVRRGGVALTASNDPPVGGEGGGEEPPGGGEPPYPPPPPPPPAPEPELPDGKTVYLMHDAFEEGGPNQAEVRVTVTPQGGGSSGPTEYLWAYTLTHTSKNSILTPDMYDEEFDYFSLSVGDATGIIAPGATVHPSGSGGSVVWTGLGIGAGATRTVVFTQPARPVAAGSAMGFSETEPPLKYGMERPETTAINGLLPAPAKPPTVSLSTVSGAVEPGVAPANTPGQPGSLRVSRTGGSDGFTRPLTVRLGDRLTGTADNGFDYPSPPASVTIPAGESYVDVPVPASKEGVWEWPGPETIDVELLPYPSRYDIGGSKEATVGVSEVGQPAFTPEVDNTADGADDYSQVGVPVDVGYRIAGDSVLNHGTVVFRIESGPGEINGPTEVAFSTDAAGNAYAKTHVVPNGVGEIKVAAVLRQQGGQRPPPDKPLPNVPVAGVKVMIGSEGSMPDANGLYADGHIKNKNTPAGMADRIPPRVFTEGFVYVQGNLPAGANLALFVRDQSDLNGTVGYKATDGTIENFSQPVYLGALFPTNVQGTTGAKVSLAGIKQTTPSNAGNLRVQVYDANKPPKLNVASHGFSVAAIPIAIKMDLYNSGTREAFPLLFPNETKYKVRWGVTYSVIPVSDSGVFADLNKISIKENIVNEVAINLLEGYSGVQNFNFIDVGDMIAQSKDLPDFIGLTVPTDKTVPADAVRVASDLLYGSLAKSMTDTGKTSGTITNNQYFTFKDARTGSGELKVKASGFKHTITVSKVDGSDKFKMLVKKVPTANNGVEPGVITDAAAAEFPVFITKPAP